jgi:hypothetical protein
MNARSLTGRWRRLEGNKSHFSPESQGHAASPSNQVDYPAVFVIFRTKKVQAMGYFVVCTANQAYCGNAPTPLA